MQARLQQGRFIHTGCFKSLAGVAIGIDGRHSHTTGSQITGEHSPRERGHPAIRHS